MTCIHYLGKRQKKPHSSGAFVWDLKYSIYLESKMSFSSIFDGLQLSATPCNSLQLSATRGNSRQLAATHCNTGAYQQRNKRGASYAKCFNHHHLAHMIEPCLTYK